MLIKMGLVLWATGFLSMTAMAQQFDLQGHRGARGLSPENTLAGFARALTIGVSTLEMDVGISRDGIVVVTHNPRLDPDITRDADGAWLTSPGAAIRSLSVEQLKAYDVGRIKPATRYAKRHPHQTPVDGARMPTLSQVFDLVRRSGNSRVRLNIEAKLNPEKSDLTFDPETFAVAILKVADDFGMSARVTIQSFDWRVLRVVQRLAPAVATSYITVRQSWRNNLQPPWTAEFKIGDFDGSIPRLIKAAGGRGWSPFHREVDAAQIQSAHELGLKVVVWTVNDPARMDALIDIGVDGIITDYPNRLRLVLERRGLETPTPTPVNR